jgi:hypothetical protein
MPFTIFNFLRLSSGEAVPVTGLGLLRGFSSGQAIPLTGNGFPRRLSTGETIATTGFGLLREFAVPTGFYVVKVVSIEPSTPTTKEDTTLFEVNVHAKPTQPLPMPGTRRELL